MSQQQGDIQERIAAARREADSLKEKIRAKKESSADTSCECTISPTDHFDYNVVPTSARNGC
jgi:guanine nucleotide-binding protein G(I)/G(S)/G(T) subunit beta-1